MSKYTTGELAKLSGVSVRTVQYYDSRGILTPSELTEGGRRLYTEEDLSRLKIICFLRELDLPINSIGNILKEEYSEDILVVLLQEQEKKLRSEMAERQLKLDKLNELRQTLKKVEYFSVKSIGDIAHIMENKKKLRMVRAKAMAAGIVMDIVEVATLILWIREGIWWPFALGMCVVAAMGVWISRFYFRSIAYICPKCHKVFRPSFRQVFWANHTPTTRKLTCVHCGYRGFCVETYGVEEAKEG